MIQNINRFFDKSLSAALLFAFFAGFYVGLFYTFNNLTLLRSEGIYVLFGIMILPIVFTTLAIYVLLYLVGKREKAPVLAVFVVSAFLLVTLNPAFLDIKFVRSYFYSFSENYILANAVFVLVGASLATLLLHRRLEICGVFLAVMSLSSIVMGFGSVATEPSPLAKKGALGEYLQQVRLAQTPNIYFFLLDGFGSLGYLRERGVDVSYMTKGLSDLGFQAYEDAYSSYQTTTSSMPAMLDMAHHYYTLNEGRVHFTEVSRASRRVIAGDNHVSHILRNNGYDIQYIHNGSYLLLQGCSADSCFPAADKLVGVKIILSHIFKRDLLSDADKVSRFSAIDELQAEMKRLIEEGPEPRFQYVHVYAPNHTPKEQSGHCDESLEIQSYERRVESASIFVLGQIGYILSRDPGAVIVLAGDHGPYFKNQCDSLAKIDTPEEYRDRSGILMAIRWPSDYRGEYDDSLVTSVNLFRYVLAALADEKAPLLDTVAAEDVFVLRRNGHAYRVLENGLPLAEPQRIRF